MSLSHFQLISHNKPETENHSEEGWGAGKLTCRRPLGMEKINLALLGEQDRLGTGRSQLGQCVLQTSPYFIPLLLQMCMNSLRLSI